MVCSRSWRRYALILRSIPHLLTCVIQQLTQRNRVLQAQLQDNMAAKQQADEQFSRLLDEFDEVSLHSTDSVHVRSTTRL